jgi:predicted ATP-dependent serine protease
MIPIDLAVVAAILSSNEDIPVNKGFALLEKVCQGKLSRKPRGSTHSGSRKLGFSTILYLNTIKLP